MIWLVGAGAGDYGMFTLRGLEVLKRADVVIYDRLVGESILSLIPDNAVRIDAGKISGHHKISQNDIQNLIINYAQNGKNVVRLKGGDPFLFGRGGEEAQAIIQAGLDFEVVPGVSSALAVPEFSGIPVTHRDFCSGVNIFTGHDKNNLLPDFDNTTSIFLMSVGNSKILQEKLTSKYPPDTPCAIIENGTTSRERKFLTQLKSLNETIIKNNVKSPAIIVVGKVAELNLSWRKNLRLYGKRILITRPQGRGETLAEKLRNEGAEVILMPTIKTEIIKNSLKNKNLSGYDWIGFTSVTGVECLFEILRENDRDIREIGNSKIAAVGEATKNALNSHGLKVDFVPKIYDVENLAEGLRGRGKILLLRALNGTKTKHNFDEIYIYETKYVKLKHIPEFSDIIIFTSSSTVKGFVENTKDFRNTKVVCIGRQTAEEARDAGFVDIKISEKATEDSIFNAILEICPRKLQQQPPS